MKDFKIEVIGDVHATPTPVVTPAPVEPTTHDVYLAEETSYDAEKGGVYVSTTGAAAWSGALFAKFGANYGLTDKKFSSVIVNLEFYKDGQKVTTAISAADCISVTIASSSDYGNNKEAQEYNAGSGQTTISGTNMVANTIAFQWKKNEAELTNYDAVLIKSIKLVEAPASDEPKASDIDVDLSTLKSVYKSSVSVTSTGAAVSITDWDSNITMSIKLAAGTTIQDYKGIKFDVVPIGDSEDANGVLNYKTFNVQIEKQATGYFSGYFSGTQNVLLASQKTKIAKGTESYTTLSFDFDWTDVADIKKSQLEDGATVTLGLHLSGANQYGYGIKNIVLYV